MCDAKVEQSIPVSESYPHPGWRLSDYFPVDSRAVEPVPFAPFFTPWGVDYFFGKQEFGVP